MFIHFGGLYKQFRLLYWGFVQEKKAMFIVGNAWMRSAGSRQMQVSGGTDKSVPYTMTESFHQRGSLVDADPKERLAWQNRKM